MIINTEMSVKERY